MATSSRSRMFTVPASSDFATVKVPFSSLVAVRGPVINENAPPFNATSVYQLGMVISKFKIAKSTETVTDFRAGPFSLDIQEIGFFSDSKDEALPITPALKNVTASAPGGPLAPVFKALFSEQSRRR